MKNIKKLNDNIISLPYIIASLLCVRVWGPYSQRRIGHHSKGVAQNPALKFGQICTLAKFGFATNQRTSTCIQESQILPLVNLNYHNFHPDRKFLVPPNFMGRRFSYQSRKMPLAQVEYYTVLVQCHIIILIHRSIINLGYFCFSSTIIIGKLVDRKARVIRFDSYIGELRTNFEGGGIAL